MPIEISLSVDEKTFIRELIGRAKARNIERVKKTLQLASNISPEDVDRFVSIAHRMGVIEPAEANRLLKNSKTFDF